LFPRCRRHATKQQDVPIISTFSFSSNHKVSHKLNITHINFYHHYYILYVCSVSMQSSEIFDTILQIDLAIVKRLRMRALVIILYW